MADWPITLSGAKALRTRSMAASSAFVQGPVLVEAESSAGRGDACRDVEQPVTDGLGSSSAELADAADLLGPGEQIVRAEAELHPHVVVDDVVERQVREPGRFRVADHVLGASALALSQFERSDVVATSVGDERGVSEPFDGVEQRQLCARVRAFTTHINRVPAGHASRFTNSVSSTTSAPSRR